jgi:hypothetical protein
MRRCTHTLLPLTHTRMSASVRAAHTHSHARPPMRKHARAQTYTCAHTNAHKHTWMRESHIGHCAKPWWEQLHNKPTRVIKSKLVNDMCIYQMRGVIIETEVWELRRIYWWSSINDVLQRAHRSYPSVLSTSRWQWTSSTALVREGTSLTIRIVPLTYG